MAWSSQARAAAAGVKRTGAVTAQDRALGVVCAASWANCPSRDLSGPAAGMPQYCWRHEPDAVAVDRAVSGDRPPRLSPPELTEAIRRLARLGLSASQIAARCGVTPALFTGMSRRTAYALRDPCGR